MKAEVAEDGVRDEQDDDFADDKVQDLGDWCKEGGEEFSAGDSLACEETWTPAAGLMVCDLPEQGVVAVVAIGVGDEEEVGASIDRSIKSKSKRNLQGVSEAGRASGDRN